MIKLLAVDDEAGICEILKKTFRKRLQNIFDTKG